MYKAWALICPLLFGCHTATTMARQPALPQSSTSLNVLKPADPILNIRRWRSVFVAIDKPISLFNLLVVDCKSFLLPSYHSPHLRPSCPLTHSLTYLLRRFPANRYLSLNIFLTADQARSAFAERQSRTTSLNHKQIAPCSST